MKQEGVKLVPKSGVEEACMPPAGAEGIETTSTTSAGVLPTSVACMPPAGAEGIETQGARRADPRALGVFLHAPRRGRGD